MFFFFNDTATTEIYTLSLHDALPISSVDEVVGSPLPLPSGDREAVPVFVRHKRCIRRDVEERSEEHTSELQSRQYLVCRLLLEKKKKNIQIILTSQTYPHYYNYISTT